MKAKLIITGLALMATTAIMSAQCQGNGQANCKGNGKGSGFVDANKNGICDKAESKSDSTSNNKGKCNGKGQGKGKHFVDANKNGVCDNYEARNKK